MSDWMFIPGTAQHKGSTQAFVPKGWTRAVTTSTNKLVAGWEATIAAHVRTHLVEAEGLLPGVIPWPRPNAVRLGVEFVRPRTASAPKTYTPNLTTKPDLDKLLRALGDGLNGVLYSDDAQVVGFFYLEKRTAERDEQPGIWLRWKGYQSREVIMKDGPVEPPPVLTPSGILA